MPSSADAKSENNGLRGSWDAALDKKFRILLPPELRSALGEDFVACFGEAGCVTLYPKDEWADLMWRLERFSVDHSGRQDYARHICGSAVEGLNCDAGGRLTIPQRLKRMGKLEGDVVINGCGGWVEIWDVNEDMEMSLNPTAYMKDRRDHIREAKRSMKWE